MESLESKVFLAADFGQWSSKLVLSDRESPLNILDYSLGSAISAYHHSNIHVNDQSSNYSPLTTHSLYESFIISQSSVSDQNSKYNTLSLITNLFEDFNFTHGQILPDVILSQLSFGFDITSPFLFIDFGEFETRIIPMCDGYILSECIETTSIGGSTLTNLIQKELSRSGQSLTPINTHFLKKEILFLSQNFFKLESTVFSKGPLRNHKNIKLPDMTLLNVEFSGSMIPEIYFYPQNFGENKRGLIGLIQDVIDVI